MLTRSLLPRWSLLGGSYGFLGFRVEDLVSRSTVGIAEALKCILLVMSIITGVHPSQKKTINPKT